MISLNQERGKGAGAEQSMVPEAGLEPAQGCPYRILSPARLPFHHSGTRANIDNERALGLQERGRFRENVVVVH